MLGAQLLRGATTAVREQRLELMQGQACHLAQIIDDLATHPCAVGNDDGPPLTLEDGAVLIDTKHLEPAD